MSACCMGDRFDLVTFGVVDTVRKEQVDATEAADGRVRRKASELVRSAAKFDCETKSHR